MAALYPPGWYADPAGRHALRWHDGDYYTELVGDRGGDGRAVIADDPLAWPVRAVHTVRPLAPPPDFAPPSAPAPIVDLHTLRTVSLGAPEIARFEAAPEPLAPAPPHLAPAPGPPPAPAPVPPPLAASGPPPPPPRHLAAVPGPPLAPPPPAPDRFDLPPFGSGRSVDPEAVERFAAEQSAKGPKERREKAPRAKRASDEPVREQAIHRFKGQVDGKDAALAIYPDRIAWLLKRARRHAQPEKIAISAITSMAAQAHGDATTIRVFWGGTTTDFRMPDADAEKVKPLLVDLVLGS